MYIYALKNRMDIISPAISVTITTPQLPRSNALDIKPKMHHIAIFNDILFAFQSHLAGFF